MRITKTISLTLVIALVSLALTAAPSPADASDGIETTRALATWAIAGILLAAALLMILARSLDETPARMKPETHDTEARRQAGEVFY